MIEIPSAGSTLIHHLTNVPRKATENDLILGLCNHVGDTEASPGFGSAQLLRLWSFGT